ncbi:Uncharacterised protein [Escherichia coli]|nr:Uncharacterised protein [Escherichia coli]
MLKIKINEINSTIDTFSCYYYTMWIVLQLQKCGYSNSLFSFPDDNVFESGHTWVLPDSTHIFFVKDFQIVGCCV